MKPMLQWLTDPTVFQVNRLDAHSDHRCYASREEMEAKQSSLYLSLDGSWLFSYSPSAAQRPDRFWEGDEQGFSPIQVPGHMELQGYGQIHYTNVLYPWDGKAEILPPEIDWEHTAVGSYVRRFTLPENFRDKRVCISFQGVERAFYVWLNGQFVGYSEDSFTPADFDLTEFLLPGENRLCVQVYQHSSASWLEDQDFFRFFGIFRSVFLYAKPRIHVQDLWLRTDFSPEEQSGTLQIWLKLEGNGALVSCRIADEQELLPETELQLREKDGYWYSQGFVFPGVTPWCHENPHLYRFLLTVRDAQGNVVELIPYEAGFRRFEKKGNILCLNGQRIIFRGVNRHEWNPATGRAIGKKDMEAAMEVFQRNNINAVRTSHYPNQSGWYGLCDRKGIYVVDETNLESHGSWQKCRQGVEPSWNVPGSLPQWKECVLDRARSMLERDKNHTSILIWSCGNESYAGDDIAAMSDYFHRQDPSRPVHYEGVFHNRRYASLSDVESQMYTSPEKVRNFLEEHPEKPFLLCEYMHDMGNSLGGMESYIRLLEEFPQFQGGFIWDYMDQALWQENALGQRVLGYGGDFGDRHSDYAFSGNGIVFADGTEKPAMQEVRYWYQSPEQRENFDRENAKNKALSVDPVQPVAQKLKIVHGDGSLGVYGQAFQILFSYVEGGPVSLRKDGREWLWRAPRPALWRAPTENDRGCGFDKRSALWAAVELGLTCTDLKVEEAPGQVCVRCTFTAPAMPGLHLETCYTVSESGTLRVVCSYQGAENRPQLPIFGLRFQTPAPLKGYTWCGPSGETYPDRKKGGIWGVHRDIPHIPAYLVPQECGGHEDVQWLTLDGGLHLSGPFGFSVLPYTPQQLDAAQHVWELPVPCRSVVTVYSAMRGVGGIDSWGSDVEAAYQLSSREDHRLEFSISL